MNIFPLIGDGGSAFKLARSPAAHLLALTPGE
jgi:hypothetical protein